MESLEKEEGVAGDGIDVSLARGKKSLIKSNVGGYRNHDSRVGVGVAVVTSLCRLRFYKVHQQHDKGMKNIMTALCTLTI